MNIKVLVATHCNLSRELLKTVKDIMGKSEDVKTFHTVRDKDIETLRTDFDSIMKKLLDSNNAVLILTDMLGGTPTNIALPYLSNDRVDIVTGVNLPMLITAVHKIKEMKNVHELADIVSSAAIKSVTNCRDHVDY